MALWQRALQETSPSLPVKLQLVKGLDTDEIYNGWGIVRCTDAKDPNSCAMLEIPLMQWYRNARKCPLLMQVFCSPLPFFIQNDLKFPLLVVHPLFLQESIPPFYVNFAVDVIVVAHDARIRTEKLVSAVLRSDLPCCIHDNNSLSSKDVALRDEISLTLRQGCYVDQLHVVIVYELIEIRPVPYIPHILSVPSNVPPW